jgi:hypothetical protein
MESPMFASPRLWRQGAATAALIGLSIVPTVLVAGYAWRVRRPGHAREAEVALSRRLSHPVALESVRYPRPGEEDFRGLVLRREDGRGASSRLATLASIDRLRARADGTRLVLRADGLRLVAEHPGALVGSLDALLVRLLDGRERVELIAPQARIETGRDDAPVTMTWRELAAVLGREAETMSLALSFHIGDGTEASRCELALTRTAEAGVPVVRLRVQTTDGPVPARVLDPLLDATAWFGDAAEIQGVLTFERRGAGDWDAEFRGAIRAIDLAALARGRFEGLQLTGRAALEIDAARWSGLPHGQGRGWREARGRFRAEHGAIGRDLLAGLAREMRFRTLEPGEFAPDAIIYDAIGLAFALNERGEIACRGALGEGFAPEAVAVRGGGTIALLGAPDGVASVHGLWKVLYRPSDDVLVPVTAESQLLRHLPLPSASEARGAPVRAN